MRILSLLMIPALILSSCVPPTRFKALQSESLTCQQERDLLKAANEELSVEIRETRARLDQAEKTLQQASKDTLRWKTEVDRLTRQNTLLTNDYQDLQEAQEALLNGSSSEIRRLMEELQVTQKDLQVYQKDLQAKETELNERNARLAQLEKVLQEQESAVVLLRKKVSDALLGFENQGLTVTQKNGKVYVSLEEQLLFKSGSTVVDPKGIQALKKLAGVLVQNPDINVLIEGHTDDVPVISGSAYKDNWDLSVLRATAIVRILLEGSSINPQRLTTAGRSEYLPVDPAKTATARQKNRRTEIILSPKLDELYRIIEN
jgi:chemotaxis protein MotB